jgi:DNA-directed RNA polymerase subunit RPC12/RpoP
MPKQPESFDLICTQCGHRRLVRLSGDALGGRDLIALSPRCEKCGGEMERRTWGWDATMTAFKNLFEPESKSSDCDQ